MRIEKRRIAPFGLYLAILALLASAVLYILQREWNLALQLSLGFTLIGLAVFAVLDPERVRMAITGRQARYGSNALVMSLAFLGILVVVNYLIYQYPRRWDMTEDKSHTLQQQSLDTLKALPQKVEVTAYYTQNTSSDQAKTLLDNYKIFGNGKLDYKFVDPNADPVGAKQANVTTDGTLVLTMGDRQEKVTNPTEQEVTSALVRLMAKKEMVYFLTGHGEYSPDDTGNQSYSQIKQTLDAKNYTVNTLNLLVTNKIPDDAKIIVVAGPKKPLSENEVKLLSDFQVKGGGLIVMEEPVPLTDFGNSPDPLADYLAKGWNIKLGADVIIDTTSNQPSVALAAEYGTHIITDKLQRLATVFPTARSVTAGSNPSGVTLTELVKTAPQSWAETNMAELAQGAQVKYDQGQDQPGPISLAVAGDNTNNKSRVVAFGDSDFATDAYFGLYGNGDLWVNSVDWVGGQENLINLTPKQPTQRLLVPPKPIVMNLILLGSVFVLPGIVLATGIVVWFQRRRRG